MPLTDEHVFLFYFILFLKDENRLSHNISMVQMKNENYEIIQPKKERTKKISNWGV